jgi:hemerythrin family non-heme iron protein
MAFDIPSPFVWDPSFDVKNDTINEQHKGLFTAISAVEKDASAANVGHLVELVKAHFKTEEDLFAKYGYADAISHKKTHDDFLVTVGGLSSFGAGEVDFAKQWLVKHIKGSDMSYSNDLAGKSL